jgi:hypothetical protein
MLGLPKRLKTMKKPGRSVPEITILRQKAAG